jgi:hypothetical protein
MMEITVSYLKCLFNEGVLVQGIADDQQSPPLVATCVGAVGGLAEGAICRSEIGFRRLRHLT